MLDVGDDAPDFRLPSTTGADIALSGHRGTPVVLYFYPKDHTIGCTFEARSFRSQFEIIGRHRVVILGVSRDNIQNQCEFQARQRLPFELLSDTDETVHDAYGAWKRSLIGTRTVRRCTYIIDPDGRIAHRYPSVAPVGHAKQVVRHVNRLAGNDWSP